MNKLAKRDSPTLKEITEKDLETEFTYVCCQKGGFNLFYCPETGETGKDLGQIKKNLLTAHLAGIA